MASDDPWQTAWQARLKKEMVLIDLDPIERFIDWRAAYTGKGRPALIRIESNTAGVFSNDLVLLNTLQRIDPGMTIAYTRVDNNIPEGLKYYAKEPPYKYRVYLRFCKLSDNSSFRDDLKEFVDRYTKTDTTIEPSRALRAWIWGPFNQWRAQYCMDHFYLDYNNPSTYTLISLMFGDMLSAMYKLEKRPQ